MLLQNIWNLHNVTKKAHEIKARDIPFLTNLGPLVCYSKGDHTALGTQDIPPREGKGFL